MKIFLQALVLLTFISCNKIGVSETEVKAVDKVLVFYGGQVNRSIGFHMENSDKINFFELKISESPLLNQDQEWLTVHAGNIAYLFYSNLNKNEKSKYNQIRVSIELTSGESRSYKFSDNELKEIENLSSEVEKINGYIKYTDYPSLVAHFDERTTPLETEVSELFERLKSEYGMITDIKMHGFTFFVDEEYGECVEIIQVMSLKEESGPLILIYDREAHKLLGLHLP